MSVIWRGAFITQYLELERRVFLLCKLQNHNTLGVTDTKTEAHNQRPRAVIPRSNRQSPLLL